MLSPSSTKRYLLRYFITNRCPSHVKSLRGDMPSRSVSSRPVEVQYVFHSIYAPVSPGVVGRHSRRRETLIRPDPTYLLRLKFVFPGNLFPCSPAVQAREEGDRDASVTEGLLLQIILRSSVQIETGVMPDYIIIIMQTGTSSTC